MKSLLVALLSVLILTLNSNVFSEQEKPDRSDKSDSIIKSKNLNKQENEQSQKRNYLIDFSDYEEGSIDEWLKNKGFKFEQAAKNRKKLDLDVEEVPLITSVALVMDTTSSGDDGRAVAFVNRMEFFE